MVQDIRSEVRSMPCRRTHRHTIRHYDRARVIERPDGFIGRTRTADGECGALPDPDPRPRKTWSTATSPTGPGETLAEAEDELGISDWIDPDTERTSRGRRAAHRGSLNLPRPHFIPDRQPVPSWPAPCRGASRFCFLFALIESHQSRSGDPPDYAGGSI
ncbi:MAG: hypothetical protein M5R42_05520 [Rhodocyclaceae bacterium]|nr:hypothetical protein [Rhodocyclaceae bacterium]